MTNSTAIPFIEYLQHLDNNALSALSDCIHLEQNRRCKECVSRINATLDELANLVSKHDRINVVNKFTGEILAVDYKDNNYHTLGEKSLSSFKIIVE